MGLYVRSCKYTAENVNLFYFQPPLRIDSFRTMRVSAQNIAIMKRVGKRLLISLLYFLRFWETFSTASNGLPYSVMSLTFNGYVNDF